MGANNGQVEPPFVPDVNVQGRCIQLLLGQVLIENEKKGGRGGIITLHCMAISGAPIYGRAYVAGHRPCLTFIMPALPVWPADFWHT